MISLEVVLLVTGEEAYRGGIPSFIYIKICSLPIIYVLLQCDKAASNPESTSDVSEPNHFGNR